MIASPLLPPPTLLTAIQRASACLLHYIPQPDDLTLGAVSLRGSSAATFARASAGPGIASDGRTYTAPIGVPRYEWVDVDGDSIKERPALIVEDAGGGVSREACGWAAPYPPLAAETWVVDLWEAGAAASGLGGIVCACSDQALSNPMRSISAVGGVYVATHHNGTSSVNSAVVGSPALNSWVRLWCRWYANGSVRLAQSVNGAAMAEGPLSGSLALPAAWGTSTTKVGYWLQGPSGPGGAKTRCLEWWAVPDIVTEREAAGSW